MNNILYKQLQDVKSTEIKFDINTTKLVIPKTIRFANQAMKKGGVYDIKIKPTIFNSDSSLADNWNNGIIPEYECYTVEVEDSMANMIKVNGVAIENNTSQFYGWLPLDGFEVIKAEEMR